MNAAELRGASKPSLDEALGWVGSRVDDIYGAGVGRLEDVWIDPGTGMPRWLLVKEGRFGGRTTLIPFEDATAGAGHVWIPYERDVVRDAPLVQPGTPLTKKLESALRDHYSATSPDDRQRHRSYADADVRTAAGQRTAAMAPNPAESDERVPVAAHHQYEMAQPVGQGAVGPAASAAFGAPLHSEDGFNGSDADQRPGPPEPRQPPAQGRTRPVSSAPPAPAPPRPQAPSYYAPPARQFQAPEPAWSPPYQAPVVQPIAPPPTTYTAPPPIYRPRAPQPPSPSMRIRDLGNSPQGPQPEQGIRSSQAAHNGNEDDQRPAAVPVIQSLDRPQRVEIELTGGIKISGELTGFSLTPLDEDPTQG